MQTNRSFIEITFRLWWLERYELRRTFLCTVLLLLLCSIVSPATRAQSNPIRDKILGGEPVFIGDSEPKIVEASWLREAVLGHKPVLIARAVIRGRLDLKYQSVEQEFELDDCVVEDYADLSHAVFKRIFASNSSTYRNGITFEHTTFEDGAYFGKDNFVTGAVVFQAAQFRGPFVATRNQFRAGTTLNFHYAHFDNFAFFNFSNFEARTFFTGAHFTAEAAFDGVNFNQVSFEHSVFGSGAHFETTLFNGPVTFDGATIHAVYFSETGTVANFPQMIDAPSRSTATAQFQSEVDFRGCTYDRIQVATAAILRKSDGSSRIQPYDREVFLRLETAFRKQGQDDIADSIYLEGRRVERKLKWRSGYASNYAPDFLLFILTNYGVRPYTRLVPIAIISLALGAWFFARSGAVSWETADRLTKWQRFVQACLVSFRSFVPLDLPLASHWQLGKEPVKLPVKFMHITIRPSTVATILRLLGAIIVPLTILALSGYLRYVPR